MTKTEFLPSFAMLCEVYNREATKLLAEGYYMVLKELDINTFNTAIANVMSGRKYSTLPLPADILESVIGNPEDNAILALKMVEDAMKEHGAYKSVSFDDKIALTCIENLGGWITICQMELKDWEWKKKEFITLYKALMRNPQNIKHTPYLAGICEHQNRLSGYDEEADTQEVAMIGYNGSTHIPVLQLQMAQKSTNAIEYKRDIGLLVKTASKVF